MKIRKKMGVQKMTKLKTLFFLPVESYTQQKSLKQVLGDISVVCVRIGSEDP